MPRKLKFRPQIARIKLNPEQAVLACPCWQGQYIDNPTYWQNIPIQPTQWYCTPNTRGGANAIPGTCSGSNHGYGTQMTRGGSGASSWVLLSSEYNIHLNL